MNESKMKVSEWFESEKDYKEALEEAESNASTDWEMTFVEDMQERFEKHKMNSFLSDAQYQIINRLQNPRMKK